MHLVVTVQGRGGGAGAAGWPGGAGQPSGAQRPWELWWPGGAVEWQVGGWAGGAGKQPFPLPQLPSAAAGVVGGGLRAAGFPAEGIQAWVSCCVVWHALHCQLSLGSWLGGWVCMWRLPAHLCDALPDELRAGPPGHPVQLLGGVGQGADESQGGAQQICSAVRGLQGGWIYLQD